VLDARRAVCPPDEHPAARTASKAMHEIRLIPV